MWKTGPRPRSLEEAWQYVQQNCDKFGKGCWGYFKASPIGIGYRTIRAGGSIWYVHRLAYQMHHKNLTSDMVICHSCDQPACCNPEHLFASSHAGNVQDKINKNRHGFGETHYKSKLTEEQVREIKTSGLSYQMLADIYGISRGGIHNIKHGRSWKHVK